MDSISTAKFNNVTANAADKTAQVLCKGNADGMAQSLFLADKDFHGLCFINLVILLLQAIAEGYNC